MAVRVIKLAKNINVGLTTLEEILRAMGYADFPITPNSMVPDDMANQIMGYYSDDVDVLTLIENSANNESTSLPDSKFPLKIVGRIDLNEYNNGGPYSTARRSNISEIPSIVKYSEEKSFWIDDLIVLSPTGKANRISVGSYNHIFREPLYSVLIGGNGVGKSTLLKEIVDFFVDLHACVNEVHPKLSSVKKFRLRGIHYHIDGIECEVARLDKTYVAKIDGYVRMLRELRLPLIVACHFGAFDKFPIQKVNGSAQTKYDVPCYKYVGAHVNGNMISSSAIAFRLLFSLTEHMDERQRQNIRSALDFIGYDHKISLQYSFVLKSKKDAAARVTIADRVEKDKEYSGLNKQEKTAKIDQLYNFYKRKSSSTKAQQIFEIDFDNNESEASYSDLQRIYKLKQCDLIASTNVLFHKCSDEITSDEMSSGEFAMLSTILSVSAAANDPHTLVLLDEPELSQHPNWQMSLIDNLDCALAHRVCHLLIATHSHMIVSDLPMKRSCVTQLEIDSKGSLQSSPISECTYGWSAEEVLLKVFKVATDRNRYFGERISKLLEQMGDNTIHPEDVADELKDLQEISQHLSDVDPMKAILNTIVDAYKR